MVVGCGLIGVKIIKELEMNSNLDLTVVDRRDYYENTTGALRAAVNYQFLQQTSMPHHAWCTTRMMMMMEMMASGFLDLNVQA